MQVLKQPAQHIKDVETLQLTSTGLRSGSLTSDSIRPDLLSTKSALSESSSIISAGLELRKRYAFFDRVTENSESNRLKAFAASAFLVAVPVFIQAPLVRIAPTLSLAITALWLWLGYHWLKKPHLSLWGDLIIGFSWTWLAGSVYWGWFRANPYIHLPVEALGLPFVLFLMWRKKADTGNAFYLGSLIGTAITDLYFYCVGLIPYWRSLMVNDPSQSGAILHSALLKMGTYEGVGYAIVLLTLLIMLGTIPMRVKSVKLWAFSGAILSTILVDSLFFVAALLA